MTTHWLQGPSSASRTYADEGCPGSVDLSRGLPNEDSLESLEGHLGHQVFETCLVLDVRPGECDECLDDDMAAGVQIGLDYVETLRNHPGFVTGYVETTFEPNEELPEFGGTPDYACVLEGAKGRHTLVVVDFKYGVGRFIDPDKNLQLGGYGVLVRRQHPEVKDVLLVVIQPRRGEEPIRAWKTNSKWLDQVEKKVRKAWNENYLRVGSHCRYCPALSDCEAFDDHVKALQGNPEFAPNVSNDRLVEIVDSQDAISHKVSKARDILKARLMRGDKVKGVKLVQAKRNARVFETDEDELLDSLEAAGVPRSTSTTQKILSPSQLEKELGTDEAFRHLVTRKPTGLTVAPTNDKRKAFEPLSSQEHFKD